MPCARMISSVLPGAVRACQFLLFLVPQQQVPVVAVELVEVGAFARTLSSGAESDFAQSSEFFEQVRHLGGARRVDGKLAAFREQLLGRQGLDVSYQETLRHRRTQSSLAPSAASPRAFSSEAKAPSCRDTTSR